MNRATLKMLDFASRLIAHEAKATKFSATRPATAFLVMDTLRPHLTNLMGNAGFRALLARSLSLAQVEIEWLRAVQVKVDGSLEGWQELQAQLGAQEFFKGIVVLLAHLLGLLVVFIGENLTLQMVGELWPKLPPSELTFEKGRRK